jgi:hypothetical protein
MRAFGACQNIIIDGDEFTSGFLGLDWLPSRAATLLKENYESGVSALLNRLIGKYTGWTVIIEIFYSGRKMYIRPFHPTASTGPWNAYAQPKDNNWAGATLKDTTALGPSGNLPAPGAPRTVGTGAGSDTIVRFSPGTFAPGTGAPTGPGTSPDEILLHEMIHGLRMMSGRFVREPVTSNPGMENYEEFVAILISNIYRSESGMPTLRADHIGYLPLSGPTTNSAVFKSTYERYLGHLDVEQPRLCSNLRQANVTFNPLL